MVSLTQMSSQLLTLEDVTLQLQKTEPLVTTRIDHNSDVKFQLDPDWAHGIDALDRTEQVGAVISVDGKEHAITKEAILAAGAPFGLTSSYMKKIPASYSSKLLNYHYGSGMGEEAFNVLAVDDVVSAFVKPTIIPFSNLQLLDSIVDSLREKRGSDLPIYADYKFANSLRKTNIRLIFPTEQRVMQATNMPDVAENEEDVWLAGLHLVNSLDGKGGQTALEGYLFRYWCTNGATTTIPDVVPWHRRQNGQNDEVYDWAREQVDLVLGGLEGAFDQVQSLTHLNITAANTADILKQIFTDYKVPVSQRDDIRENLLGAEELTMYRIMNAITQAANLPDLADERRDWLMRIGGAIPTETFDTLKAQVWREGHTAEPTAPNPYEIVKAI